MCGDLYTLSVITYHGFCSSQVVQNKKKTPYDGHKLTAPVQQIFSVAKQKRFVSQAPPLSPSEQPSDKLCASTFLCSCGIYDSYN